MKRTRNEAAELEAELLRLNALVRQRRNQLARLESCPNKDCECRQVWRQVIEEKLATQVGNVRKQVRGKSAKRTDSRRRKRRAS